MNKDSTIQTMFEGMLDEVDTALEYSSLSFDKGDYENTLYNLNVAIEQILSIGPIVDYLKFRNDGSGSKV